MDFYGRRQRTLPLKNRKICQKRQEGISFGGRFGVSKRAAQKSQGAAIFSGNNENQEGGKVSTKS